MHVINEEDEWARMDPWGIVILPKFIAEEKDGSPISDSNHINNLQGM